MNNTININDIAVALNAIQVATKRGTFSLEEVEVIIPTTTKLKEAIKAHQEQTNPEQTDSDTCVAGVDFAEGAD